MKSSTQTMVFHVEGEDRSVGIFGESFSARMSDGAEWCDLADYQDDFDTCKFVWYSNDGDACARPNNADTVERSLHGYAKGLYSDEERHYNAYDEEK